MKILFSDPWACYPMALAGGHRVNHGLLRDAARRPGVSCHALVPKLARGTPSSEYYPNLADLEDLGVRSVTLEEDRWFLDCGYPVEAVEDPARELPKRWDDLAPDVFFGQNPRPPGTIWREVSARGVPAVCYLHDLRFDEELLGEVVAAGGRLVCCSDFMRRSLEDRFGLPARVLYPLIHLDEYRVTPESDGRITFINPVPKKGYDTFRGLVPLLADRRFLVVEGWPLGDEYERVAQELDALGADVELWRRVADVRQVYRETRILLVPSVYEEPAGRVVVEAQVSGIPVIVSNRGGLPEMLGDGGLAVAEAEDPGAWAEAIREIEAGYERFSRAARANVERRELSPAGIVDRFLDVCRAAGAGALA